VTSQESSPGIFSYWKEDLSASVVVFLVALPLCIGVAILSGVPAELGLVTGIVGGLIVGTFAGAPLQVSGPAAGLYVLVFDLVKEHGLPALGVAVLVGGAIQLVAGALKLGRWFRAVSPGVIFGMLAGIGVLIFASQFHVLVDDAPQKQGWKNLMLIPQAIQKGLLPEHGWSHVELDGPAHHLAAVVGIVSLVCLLLWAKFRPEKLKIVPAPLIAVLVGTGLTAAFKWPVAKVKVPESMTESLMTTDYSFLTHPGVLGVALALAFIASAETLLCAVAVDKLHDGPRTQFDRELMAQGVGNIICGVLGALPMTGVIVRSSANIGAGGKTRLATVIHGFWLLVFVIALPFVIAYIPKAALAAILVHTGAKLANPAQVKTLARHGTTEVLIFFATVIGIVGQSLLFGVLLGVVLSVVRMAVEISTSENKSFKLSALLEDHDDEGAHSLTLGGAATFLSVPKLAEALESLPKGASVHVQHDDLVYLDAASLELLEAWHQQSSAAGGGLVGGEGTLKTLSSSTGG